MKKKNQSKRVGKIWKVYFFPFLIILFFFIGCGADENIQTTREIKNYTITGYLSSKKDQLSFDIEIVVNENKNYYSIKGYDTLLAKERFFIFYENSRWFLKTENGLHELKNTERLGEILPPPAIFDYLAFLSGRLPLLKSATKKQEKEKISYIYQDYRQEIFFNKEDLVERIDLFYQENKIYRFEYKNYVFLDKKIFPKLMNIYDYQENRKIVWWFSKIIMEE